MAHDNQVESKIAESAVIKPFKEHSAVVADWLMLYGQTYREEVTEEMALLYQQTLKDLRADILHRAFLLAAKNCKFRPTPAEVRDAAEVVLERDAIRRTEQTENCQACHGTGWKMVPRVDGKGDWAVRCECRH